MALPVNVQDLIHGRRVENGRIEYKRRFNPLPVMHTICAFANDVNNWGGGYIILGVEALNGVPQFPVFGIKKHDQDTIYQRILELCNLMQPQYSAVVSTESVDGVEVIIIWAYAGNDRPYKCPVGLGQNSTKAYYIRKCSSTVKATNADERRLFDTSMSTPYDDMPNENAEIATDLDIRLIEGYLTTVKSKLLAQKLGLKEIASAMHLIGGQRENPKPLNFALMFFNFDPEKFFRDARIEVVIKPDPRGIGMRESIFRGPLDLQLRNALIYIKSTILVEEVHKLENRAEALRVWNYPHRCVEEILVNAIYHKGYNVSEPITVTVTPENMQIISCPGPDLSITAEAIKNRKMVSQTCRNRRVGDFLRELEFAEGRNTGIPIALASLKDNGSKPLKFETNETRDYLLVTIPCNQLFIPKVSDIEKIGSTEDVIRKILMLLTGGPKSAKTISRELDCKKSCDKIQKLLTQMVNEKQIKYFYPDQADHPKQKYVLKLEM
ncbi:MAG: putative DNA binding domain-containing protein [Christensenellaceae bacterium]|jgi:ATP-dependent DNA helicase RecG|nr:putative DNA binding domain-containing protein [Christensenellaceae bacterium]